MYAGRMVRGGDGGPSCSRGRCIPIARPAERALPRPDDGEARRRRPAEARRDCGHRSGPEPGRSSAARSRRAALARGRAVPGRAARAVGQPARRERWHAGRRPASRRPPHERDRQPSRLKGLAKHFPVIGGMLRRGARRREGGGRRQLRDPAWGDARAASANRDAARPGSAGSSSSCIEPTAGRIVLGGVDVSGVSRRRRCGGAVIAAASRSCSRTPIRRSIRGCSAGTIVGEPLGGLWRSAGGTDRERARGRAVRPRRAAGGEHRDGTRMSSPAVSASGSASPRRWPSIRT